EGDALPSIRMLGSLLIPRGMGSLLSPCGLGGLGEGTCHTGHVGCSCSCTRFPSWPWCLRLIISDDPSKQMVWPTRRDHLLCAGRPRMSVSTEEMEQTLGLEPRTCCLRNSCSTAELCRPGRAV